jgi:lipocalin
MERIKDTMGNKTRKPKVISMFSLKRYLRTKAETNLARIQHREEKRQAKVASAMAAKNKQTISEEHIHTEDCHHNEEENAHQHIETV